MLEVKHLSVTYGQHRALDDVSVQIAKGEVVVILGANGAGKSSLLRAIAGLSEGHCDGDITFDGSTLLGTTPDDIVTGGIALVPEGRAIFGDLNVEENLRLGAYNERARANEAANLDTEKREKYGSLYRLTKTQQTDYDRLDNLMKERFSNAEPFFRAASRLQPDDCETLKALQTIYTRLSRLDEEEVIIARRKALDCV